MVVAFVSGAALLVVWIVLAFVMAIPAGWVHLFLAAGSVMVARGIILSRPRPADSRTGGQADSGTGGQADGGTGGQADSGASQQGRSR